MAWREKIVINSDCDDNIIAQLINIKGVQLVYPDGTGVCMGCGIDVITAKQADKNIMNSDFNFVCNDCKHS
jgi:Fe-S cluster biogenesis protein NfuA